MVWSILKKKLWCIPRGSRGRFRAYAVFHKPQEADSNRRRSRTLEQFSRDNTLVAPSRRRLEVELNGESHRLDSWALRDSCPCSSCIDQSTTQKLFDATAIPVGIQATDLEVNADGSFSVSWTEDVAGYASHRSYYPPGFLSRRSVKATEKTIRERHPRVLWERADLETVEHDLRVKYDDYITDERTLNNVTRRLLQYGIAFISNVPSNPDSVGNIGSRIGPLKNTIYGPTWDVRSRASAKNVADTSSDLGFHMDLLYYRDPPKLQILHFLKKSKQGGQSLFSDSFKAVSTLVRQNLDPSDPTFKPIIGQQVATVALITYMQRFHYRNNGHWLEYEHPTISLEGSLKFKEWSKVHERLVDISAFENALKAVRWSPPFRAPMFRKQSEMITPPLDYWIRGARLLKKEFERKEAIFETQIEEGTCVIFDNWRVLHGRRAFAGGERWLRGAYIDDDAFRQRVLRLDDSEK